MGLSQTARVSPPRCEAFYFGAGRGARFCLLYEPPGAARGSVLYVPPFAEEQNRARRSAALTARALAQAGWVVLQMDLFGCGDSAGDFGEATWEMWLEDLTHGLSIVRKRCPGPRWLWGVRAGALLASDLVRRVDARANLLLWQPVVSGAQHLKQSLRLRRAAEFARVESPVLAESNGAPSLFLDLVSLEHASRRAQGATHQLRNDWVAGKTVEVGGYAISPGLAFSLDRAVFSLPPRFGSRVVWLDVGRTPHPGAQSSVDALRAQGVWVYHQQVADAPFWQATETVQCHALATASVAALEGNLERT